MGSWRRMGAFLGLVPDDDVPGGELDDLEPEYADARYGNDYRSDYGSDRDSGYTADQRRYETRRAGTSSGRGSANERGFDAPLTHGALAMQVEPEARRSAESGAAVRPMTVKLTGFAEARIVGERYRDGASVILDMTDLSDADARRVVDFAAGLAFALQGSIDKVTGRVFMLLPPHSDLSAEDRRAFAGSYADRYAARHSGR